MKKKYTIASLLINSKEVISESKPIFKDPDVDISFHLKPQTKEDGKETSQFIAKEKKRFQQERRIEDNTNKQTP